MKMNPIKDQEEPIKFYKKSNVGPSKLKTIRVVLLEL